MLDEKEVNGEDGVRTHTLCQDVLHRSTREQEDTARALADDLICKDDPTT